VNKIKNICKEVVQSNHLRSNKQIRNKMRHGITENRRSRDLFERGCMLIAHSLHLIWTMAREMRMSRIDGRRDVDENRSLRR
jgi:hypothetical protein